MARLERMLKFMELIAVLQFERSMDIDGIAEFMECGRRTAHRYLKEIREHDHLFTLEEVIKEEKTTTFWRIKDAFTPEIGFDPDDLAFLQKLIESSKTSPSKDPGWAREIIGKLRRLHPRGLTASFVNDFDPLLTATGFASRPGPHSPVDPDIYRTLSIAIRGGQVLEIDYEKNEKIKKHRIWPLGILYGERNYLICRPVHVKPDEEPWTFRLPDIKEARVTNEWFDVDEVGFDLSDYMSDSFGVFQNNQIWDVVWTFDETVSPEVAGYQFHHSQKVERFDDGRTRVSFQACSLVEMCHELFKWGYHVKIEGPTQLQEMYDAMRLHNWSRWQENRWEKSARDSQNL